MQKIKRKVKRKHHREKYTHRDFQRDGEINDSDTEVPWLQSDRNSDRKLWIFSNRILQKANEQVSFIGRNSYSVREGIESTEN